MSDTERPILRLQPGHHKRAEAGHPWVFSNEIQMDAAAKALPAGTAVRLATAEGRPFAVATFNPHTLIAARVFGHEPDRPLDAAFLAERLGAAKALRDRLFGKPYYRLVHAEADGLPGLIADRYGDVLALQLNTAGMQALLEPLLEAIGTVLAPRAVVLRNESAARGLEGLPSETRLAQGALDGPVELEENGVRFFADLLDGQKTGWFYDQRDNRAFVASLGRGARVLDCYTYQGGFGVQAAVAGAAEVTLLDSSQPALDSALRAAEANGVADRVRALRGEAFEELQRLRDKGESYDVVIVDPPAFVKVKKDVAAGLKGYRKLFRLAARLVRPGGILAAYSCSHHVDLENFARELRTGIGEAKRSGRILKTSGAAADHPVHPALPESAYLKGQVLQLD
ncbi:MAG TPA: class I SAM-dependent rRNA methyltransferase [Alphaproteobacteria bacterium]|nr:class I SAM-dependent rRNA methyltransferase [Alphaproteobacteria bacterium]